MRRLPTDFCHASALLALPEGGLLCCWFGGSSEGNADVAIYTSRRDAAGWSEPLKLADGAEANWNPVLYQAQDGSILLFYKEGQRIADWRTLLLTSQDGGRSWSVPRELVAGDCSGGRGPVRTKLLRLADGRLLAGGSTERGLWTAFADRSDDDGRSWQRSAAIAVAGLRYEAGEKTAESTIAVSEQSFFGRGVIQPALWQSADGGVHMLLRSSEGYLYRSDSSDRGESWCAAYATAVPNNNSGFDLVRAADGALYLLCNPVAANWGLRSPLTLLRSQDEGGSWERLLDLETEAAEFSYPALLAAGERLLLSYTWKRQNIAVVELQLSELP